MSQASFLRLNDDKSGAVDCATKSAKCGRHTLTLKSAVDQTVWITAHTWDARTLPTKCQTKKGRHMVFLEDQYKDTWEETHDEFYSGSYQFEAIKVKANEPWTIHGDWNWADANYSPDWSVVAWGDKGGLLTLTHLKGLASDKLPLLARQGGAAA